LRVFELGKEECVPVGLLGPGASIALDVSAEAEPKALRILAMPAKDRADAISQSEPGLEGRLVTPA
jgi:hypothetical protein